MMRGKVFEDGNGKFKVRYLHEDAYEELDIWKPSGIKKHDDVNFVIMEKEFISKNDDKILFKMEFAKIISTGVAEEVSAPEPDGRRRALRRSVK
jgi:hypothetical protein